MRVLDFHTHAFPDAVAEKAMTRLIRESDYIAWHDGTLGGLRAAMRRSGVSAAVVLSIATRPKQVAVINDWAIARGARGALEHAGARQSADDMPNTESLIFFGTLHPQCADNEREVERLRAAGVRGVKFHPNYQEFLPDDPALLPLFRAIADAGLIALIHAGYDVGFPDAPGSPDRLARLSDALPHLALVCAHFGGWRQWDEAERHLVGRPNVYLDTSFTLGDLPDDRFVDLARRHGIHRILFATDSPWRDQKEDLEALARLPFTEEEREAILWDNAVALLGDDPQPRRGDGADGSPSTPG